MGMTTVWALDQDKFDESDLSWCKGLGVEIKVEHLYGDVYTAGSRVHRYVRGFKIRLTTTCEKQESMLQLKYGYRLIEVQRSINLSHDERQKLNF